ncbi:WBP4 family protein [Megaselia abdita]
MQTFLAEDSKKLVDYLFDVAGRFIQFGSSHERRFNILSSADYWVSNERKFCEYCKCWIAANKASIQFHENGKRHKASMAKRITDISNNSAKAEKEQRKFEAELRKMDEAAMRSYARDISASGDMTAKSINSVVVGATTETPAGTSTGRKARTQVDPMRLEGDFSDDEDRPGYKKATDEPESQSLWIEGKSEDGHTYYWNVKTNESVWQKPKEGYMPLAEYNRINSIAIAQQEVMNKAAAKKNNESAEEKTARYYRERLKDFRKPDPEDTPEAKEEKRQFYKTAEEAATPDIGSWTTVVEKTAEELKPVDLELPEVDNYYVQVVSEMEPEPPVKKFKEKVIESLANDDDDEGPSKVSMTFKKRKAPRGNARKRLDDDE